MTNRDKPVSLAFPLAASTAALALLLVSSSLTLWCDAKDATAGGRKTANSSRNSIASATTSDSNMEIYHKLGVRPPHDSTKVLRLPGMELPIARWSWKLHGKLFPVLHIFDDGRPPDDVCVNLRVLWCKLLISLDPRSLAYEGIAPTASTVQSTFQDNGHRDHLYATYRMLPPYSIKWALRYLGLWRIFPRWMHANIELRIVYLQTALEKLLGWQRHQDNRKANDCIDRFGITSDDGGGGTAAASKGDLDQCALGAPGVDKAKNITEHVCVIILGGGYDPWGAKLLSAKSFNNNNNNNNNNASPSIVERVYELDLPGVVDSKRRLLLRAGFDVVDDDDRVDKDHQRNASTSGLYLEGVNLNDDVAVDRVLDKIRDELIKHAAAAAATDETIRWRVVVISEAVFLYLDLGKAERILEGAAQRFCRGCFHDASFVFADRLMRTAHRNQRRPGAMSLPTTPALIEEEESQVRKWLFERGWELEELLLKPGGTRHLGIATAIPKF